MDTEETEIVFGERPPSVYKVFSALIQPALSQIIPNSTNKDRTFSTMTTVCLPSVFETGKSICFQTAAQNTVLCQSIKFGLHFSCLNLEL